MLKNINYRGLQAVGGMAQKVKALSKSWKLWESPIQLVEGITASHLYALDLISCRIFRNWCWVLFRFSSSSFYPQLAIGSVPINTICDCTAGNKQTPD